MTNPAERDRAIERLLKSGRLHPRAADADACLEADTVAAWAEGTLSRAERSAAEAHAADCPRCQSLLAAMVRTEPLSGRTVPRWSPRILIRWAVPVTAAAAVALWILVDRDGAPPPSPERTIQAPAAAGARETPPPSAAPAEPAAPLARPRRSQDAKAQRPPAPSAERDELKQRRDRPESFDRMTMKEAPAQRAQESVENRLTVPPPSVPPPVPPLPQRTESAAGVAASASSARSRAAEAAPLAESVLLKDANKDGWTLIPSPDPLVRWRFSLRGQVERSIDGGATWTRQAVPVTGVLATGSAPSSSVCWIAGGGGLILRFTAAEGWRRAMLPAVADVVTITAETADRATVTLADGSRLTTTDGGATWR